MTTDEKHQRCGGCGRNLPYSDFHRDRTRVTGRVVTCRSCVSKRKKAYHTALANRTEAELEAAKPAEQKCWSCEQVLPADSFAKSRHTLRGISSVCLACKREKTRELRSRSKR